MGAKQIKVAIVDDHPVILHGVESFCNKSDVIEVVATASDYRSALEAAEKWKPDVLVLYITMALSFILLAYRGIRKKIKKA